MLEVAEESHLPLSLDALVCRAQLIRLEVQPAVLRNVACSVALAWRHCVKAMTRIRRTRGGAAMEDATMERVLQKAAQLP